MRLNLALQPGAHRSLTFRLTLLFATASSAVLLLLGVLIGGSVDRHFAAQDVDALTARIELVRQLLGRVRSAGELAALPRALDASLLGDQGIELLLVGPEGERLYASAGADFPDSLWSRDNAAEHGPAQVWTTGDGRPLRGLVRMLPTAIAGAPPARVAVAIDIAHHQHFMASFRVTLWSFVACAALATGLLGWFAARRGLAPLQAIRSKVEAITAHRLDARLPIDAVAPELRELVATLNALLVRLEASFRQLSDFSSDIAHELRTPVSNLLTQTQVTLSRPRSAEQYREVLASNCEECERLSRMIADMLFLAKADNQLLVPHREPVNLALEVASLFDFYDALAAEKSITLRCTGGEGERGVVVGDRLMLRRALGNLLSNALRHTPAGGRIDVCIEVVPRGGERAASGEQLCVAVANSGTPIAAEHLPRLFDRFYRVDGARQRQSDGVGLGLAITRSIARAHGGDASVRSDAQATVFKLCVARAPGEVEGSA